MSKVGEINFIITADNSKYRRKMSETLNDSKRLFEDLKNLQKNYQNEMLSGIEDIKSKQKDIFKDLEESGYKATSSVSDNIKDLGDSFEDVISNADSLKSSLDNIGKIDIPDIDTSNLSKSVEIDVGVNTVKAPSLEPTVMTSESVVDTGGLKNLQNMFKPIIDQSGLQGINTTFSQLKSKALSLSGDISSSITNSIKTIGKEQEATITSLGSSMIKQIGKITSAAFTSLTALGIKSAVGFDKMTSEIIKKTGWTRDQIAEMEEGLVKASNLGFSNSDIADVFSGVAINLNLEDDPLYDMSIKYLKLADIADETASSIESAGSRAMKGWQVPQDEWDEFLNYAMKTKKATGKAASDILADVSKYSDPLSVLGYDWKESMAMLGSLYKSGANSDAIMGGMKLAANKLSEIGFDDMRVGMELVIDSIDTASMSDAIDQAGSIFGTRVAADIAKAIKRGDLGLEEIMEEIEDSVSEIDDIWEDSLTLGDEFKILLKELQEIARPLGEIILDTLHTLKPMFEELVNLVAFFMEKFQELPEPLQKAIMYLTIFKVVTNNTFGGMIAGLAKFIVKFGVKISSIVSIITSAVPMIASAISGLISFLATPVGMGVAALAVLSFAAYKLITDFEGTILFFKKWGTIVPVIFFTVVDDILNKLLEIPKTWNMMMDDLGASRFKMRIADGLLSKSNDQVKKYNKMFKENDAAYKKYKATVKEEKRLEKERRDKETEESIKSITSGFNKEEIDIDIKVNKPNLEDIDIGVNIDEPDQEEMNKLEDFFKKNTARGKEEAELDKQILKEQKELEKQMEKAKKEMEKEEKQRVKEMEKAQKKLEQEEKKRMKKIEQDQKKRQREAEKQQKEMAKAKLQQQKEAEQKRKQMEEDRARAQEEAERKALDRIRDRNNFLDKTLEKHKEIVNSLKDYASLFDKITNKQLRATNPYKLMKQAEMREKAYKQREESLSILANRGVPRELLEEFMKMGIGDLGNITGLAKLNDQQLKAWLSTQNSINNRINDEASDRVITQVKMGDIVIQTSTDDPRSYKKEVEAEVYKTFKSRGVELLSF